MYCLVRGLIAVAITGLLLCVPLRVATAQEPQMPKENTRGTATLKGLFAPGVLHVQNKEGDQLLLKVDAEPKDITFAGSADVEWLQPGMLVRFTARFNKKGQALHEISDLMVFSPRESTRIGIFPDAGLGGGELFGEVKENKAKDDSASYLVAGQLTGLRGGKMTVAAGGATIKVDLADEAKVRFDFSDLRLARAGDSVSFEGWYYVAAKNQIFARRLEVIAAEPLSGEKKSRGRRLPEKTTEEGDAKPDSKPEGDAKPETKPEGDAKPESKPAGDAKDNAKPEDAP